MASLRAEIGSLSSLFAFEAAGRLGSFTRAAQELGVTQAAVSKQISALEAHLGQTLFLRHPRHVALSRPGRELFATVSGALSTIAETMRDLRETEPVPLTIALSIAMSQFWLMPILSQFTTAHPDIPVRILSQDDLTLIGEADVVIRYHKRPPANGTWLFDADVQAVAAPEFMERHPLHSPEDVLSAPLIRYDAPDRSWLDWNDWAVAAGVALPRGKRDLSVSRYQDAIIAAQEGQGIALAWRINGVFLAFKGMLLPVPGPVISSGGAFYLEAIGPRKAEVHSLVEWIEHMAKAPRS